MTVDTKTGPGQAFETCRQAADDYLNSGKTLYITAKDLCGEIARLTPIARQQVETYDPQFQTEGPFIVDLRNPDSEMRELYYYGHIPGAARIPWRSITQFKMMSTLPKDRQIVVYSNTGQTGGQAAAILSLMGYNAVNLKWGLTSWTDDKKAAPERYDIKNDVIWQNREYLNTVTINLEPEGSYPLPDVPFDGRNSTSVIWTAADSYLRDFRPANISASALYDPLFEYIHPLAVSPYEDEKKGLLVLPFGSVPTEREEPYLWPFIVDVRSEEEYESGHIPGAIHIELKDLCRVENLKKLPPDRQVVICSRTGHSSAHAVALLNILGYDAINLKWGMSGWSVNPAETGYYREDRDCLDYPVVKGWRPGRVTKCGG
jgi:rhodanese-related sulfurtransferase